MASDKGLESKVERLEREVTFLKEAVDELTRGQMDMIRSIKQFYPNFGIG